MAIRATVDDLLAEARSALPHRPTPAEALRAQAGGSILVDIRGDDQRRDGGLIPGAILLPRNSLEWRCDPASPWRHPAITSWDLRLILVCNQGYQSSLAAATLQRLGLVRATDLDGGFTAWAAAGLPVHDGSMQTEDPVLAVMDRFTAAVNSHDLDAVRALVTEDIVFESTSPPPDGTRYHGRDTVCQVWGQMLATTPQARFSVEEQFSDGSERAVVRWRYDWADGHVRGVDIVRVRHGQLAESLAYVKG
jgi:rhodanese-related sulfurtransferase